MQRQKGSGAKIKGRSRKIRSAPQAGGRAQAGTACPSCIFLNRFSFKQLLVSLLFHLFYSCVLPSQPIPGGDVPSPHDHLASRDTLATSKGPSAVKMPGWWSTSLGPPAGPGPGYGQCNLYWWRAGSHRPMQPAWGCSRSQGGLGAAGQAAAGGDA